MIKIDNNKHHLKLTESTQDSAGFKTEYYDFIDRYNEGKELCDAVKAYLKEHEDDMRDAEKRTLNEFLITTEGYLRKFAQAWSNKDRNRVEIYAQDIEEELDGNGYIVKELIGLQ